MQQTQNIRLDILNKLEFSNQLINYCIYMRTVGQKNNSFNFLIGYIYNDINLSSIFNLSLDQFYGFRNWLHCGSWTSYPRPLLKLDINKTLQAKPNIFKKFKK